MTSRGVVAGTLNVSLRTITPADEPVVRAVYASTRDAEMAIVPWDDAFKQQFLDMQHRAQAYHYATHNPDADYDLVLLDGEPVGRLYVDRTTEHIELLDIALLAPYRARGIGSLLLRGLMEEARREDRAVRCHVERFNRAWQLYERLGFRFLADAGMYAQLEWVPDAARVAAGDAASAGVR